MTPYLFLQGISTIKFLFFRLCTYIPLSVKLRYEIFAILKKFKSTFQLKLRENTNKDNFI